MPFSDIPCGSPDFPLSLSHSECEIVSGPLAYSQILLPSLPFPYLLSAGFCESPPSIDLWAMKFPFLAGWSLDDTTAFCPFPYLYPQCRFSVKTDKFCD